MKITSTLLATFLMLPFCLLAQSNFKSGYIVNLKGDTTKGFVDYREWGENPQRINFKASQQGPTEQHSTADLKAFNIIGFEDYQRYELPVSMNAIKTADLPSGIDTSFVIQPVFLRVILIGKKITLYQYVDKLKERFYTAEGANIPVELKRLLYRDLNENSLVREVNTFRLQLQRLVSTYQPDNQPLLNQTKRATFGQSEFFKIVAAINGNNAGQTNINARHDGIDFFIGIAANASQTKITGQSNFSSVNASVSILPQITLGANFYINKNVKRWAFKPEIDIMANNADFLYHGVITDYMNVYKYDETFKFKQYALSLNPQIAYNFYNKADLKLFLAAGAAFNACSYSNAEHVVTNENGEKHYDRVMPGGLLSIYYNGTAKAGLIVSNKLEVYVHYSTSSSVSNAAIYSINVSQYRIGINYLFGKK